MKYLHDGNCYSSVLNTSLSKVACKQPLQSFNSMAEGVLEQLVAIYLVKMFPACFKKILRFVNIFT
jgi:hypothetical protein